MHHDAEFQTTVPLVVVVRAGLDLRHNASASSVPQTSLGSAILTPKCRVQRTEVQVTRFQESHLDISMNKLATKASLSLVRGTV